MKREGLSNMEENKNECVKTTNIGMKEGARERRIKKTDQKERDEPKECVEKKLSK